MTFEEAKAKYEANGGHYFEWFPVFGQRVESELFEPQMTFLVGIWFEKTHRSIYSVLGFDKEFKHTLGYGNKKGYVKYEDAVKVAKKPGKPKW